MSPDNGASDYGNVTQLRGFIRDAINAEKQYEPLQTMNLGELYMALAFDEMTLAQWNRVISVNLTGQFLCAREAVR